jgi:(2Fe-2S) ferredoxin
MIMKQIYTPQGASVWYGRVSPREVESIVTNTIVGGEVLAPLLRGGMNMQKPGCKSLHDW